MRHSTIYIFSFMTILLFSCSPKIYPTNGETIYKPGRNLEGEKLLNKSASRITIVHSCRACHGDNGNKMSSVSIQYSYLSDRNNFTIPYNDSLFFRFLDHDLKSNGAKANIGVIWKMSDKDKTDLLAYLKGL